MKTITQKDFLGKTFSYEAIIDKGGNTLWTEQIDSSFLKWLHKLKDENRELFKIQYSLSLNAYNRLNQLKEKIGVYDDSLLIRAITITFINFIDTSSKRAIIKRLKKSDHLDILKQGKTLKKNLYFSPVGMRDIEAYSKLTNLTKSKVIKNALYLILLISIDEDVKIQRFWEYEILEKLTTIAKAA